MNCSLTGGVLPDICKSIGNFTPTFNCAIEAQVKHRRREQDI